MQRLPSLISALCLFFTLQSLTLAAETPPNFVFILVDDMGWKDLGCYGSSFYETPHIDRLADGGMRFTTAYAACPVCSPTRASIMSGKSTARVGFTGHITAINRYRFPENSRIFPPKDHMKLRLEETSIAEALKPAGYVSGSFGKWHLGPEGFWPRDQGFDVNIAGWTHGSPPSHFFPYQSAGKPWNSKIPTMQGGKEGEYLTDRLTDEAIRFIEKNQKQPFFVYLTHYAVHSPIQAPEKLVKKYRAKLKTDQSQSNPTYAAMIESVDDGVGKIMNTLDRLDLTDNTIVIFFSDNGGVSKTTNNAPLREGKAHLYEGGIRVPLIVKWPGHIAGKTTSDEKVISHDLLPTMLDLAGRRDLFPADLDGVSLKPVLTSTGTLPPRNLYWYYPLYHRRPGSVVRGDRYKMIEYYDPPAVELYDLEKDISETKDLSTELPKKVQEMRGDLQAWLKEIDPIMHTANPNWKP